MPDNDSVFAAAKEWKGSSMALATVLSTWGSAPRPSGSHMLINADGRLEGSVSGGCVEGDVLALAEEVMASGHAKQRQYGVSDGSAWEVGLPCGGTIQILVQPVSAGGFAPELFDRIEQDRAAGHGITIFTNLASGRSSHEPLGEEGQFANHYGARRRLLIIGAVQIAQALAKIAATLEVDVVVIDPRSRFLTTERFPSVTLDDRWPDEAVAAYRPGPSTAVVVLSHDPKIDDPGLIAALSGRTGYVGALGSRRSHSARRERLALAGVAKQDIDRIEGPAGLSIGAQGSAEIGLSIAAAMIKALNVHE